MSNTSYFGSLIYEFAKCQGLSIRDLSERVEGTTSSTFSKIRAGNYSRITEERLERILDALVPNDKNARALMVCAYLWDMCPAAYHVSIKIEPQENQSAVMSPKDRKKGKQQPVIENLPNILDTIGKGASVNSIFFEHVHSLSKLSAAFIN